MVRWERENGFDHLRQGMDDYAAQKASGGDVYKSAAAGAAVRTEL